MQAVTNELQVLAARGDPEGAEVRRIFLSWIHVRILQPLLLAPHTRRTHTVAVPTGYDPYFVYVSLEVVFLVDPCCSGGGCQGSVCHMCVE